VLITRATQIKESFGARFIGLATGMNSLIRPALYGAYHEIVNLTRLDEAPVGLAQVVGPICESGDRLGVDRPFVEGRSTGSRQQMPSRKIGRQVDRQLPEELHDLRPAAWRGRIELTDEALAHGTRGLDEGTWHRVEEQLLAQPAMFRSQVPSP